MKKLLVILMLTACNNDVGRFAPEDVNVMMIAATEKKDERKRTKTCISNYANTGCTFCFIHTHISWGSIWEDHYEITQNCGNGPHTIAYWNTYHRTSELLEVDPAFFEGGLLFCKCGCGRRIIVSPELQDELSNRIAAKWVAGDYEVIE